MKFKSDLKAVLLDMDGVLWKGPEPVLDIQTLFDGIQSLNLQAYCVTNNSARSVDYYLERFASYDVILDRSQIITSAEATAEYLAEQFPDKGDLFVIGEDGLKGALEKRGFQIMEEESPADIRAVVVGLDRQLSYQDLALAGHYIRQEAAFIGTNPDLTFPTPAGPVPGAGTIIKAVEVSSGKMPIIIGKPQPMLYELALKRANSLPEEAIMIGDRLDTDILGAQQLGINAALVLTGISNREDAIGWNPAPKLIATDAVEVIGRIGESHGTSN